MLKSFGSCWETELWRTGFLCECGCLFRTTANIVTQHANCLTCVAGDEVYLTAYMRSLEGTAWQLPEGSGMWHFVCFFCLFFDVPYTLYFFYFFLFLHQNHNFSCCKTHRHNKRVRNFSHVGTWDIGHPMEGHNRHCPCHMV